MYEYILVFVLSLLFFNALSTSRSKAAVALPILLVISSSKDRVEVMVDAMQSKQISLLLLEFHHQVLSLPVDLLVGLVVRRPPRERVRITPAPGFFRGRVIPVT